MKEEKMTGEKRAQVTVNVYGSQEREKVMKRYQVGARIGETGIVEKIEQLGHQIVIYFKAASNAILTVYGSIKDSVGGNCTLVPL